MAEPGPTWTILVATLGQRADLFARLLDVLLPQLDPYQGRVRVLAYWNNGQPPLSHIRQALVEATDTDYLCFVDDDDLVPEYYVADTMAALESGPDYVGWLVQVYNGGREQFLSHHSLRFDGWYDTASDLYRDITHINPVRTVLAKKADFRAAKAGDPEDRLWVEQMRSLLETEVVIPKVMYHYLWDRQVSAWQCPDEISRGPFARPDVSHPYFAYHPDSAHG